MSTNRNQANLNPENLKNQLKEFCRKQAKPAVKQLFEQYDCISMISECTDKDQLYFLTSLQNMRLFDFLKKLALIIKESAQVDFLLHLEQCKDPRRANLIKAFSKTYSKECADFFTKIKKAMSKKDRPQVKQLLSSNEINFISELNHDDQLFIIKWILNNKGPFFKECLKLIDDDTFKEFGKLAEEKFDSKKQVAISHPKIYFDEKKRREDIENANASESAEEDDIQSEDQKVDSSLEATTQTKVENFKTVNLNNNNNNVASVNSERSMSSINGSSESTSQPNNTRLNNSSIYESSVIPFHSLRHSKNLQGSAGEQTLSKANEKKRSHSSLDS